MEFDYDGEFDRIMEEISPMSIPAHFVKQVVVKMKNGQEITLSGEELLQPLPMVENVGWNQLAKRFDKIDDVEVQIDVPAIKQNVVLNVKNILKAHFEQNKDD
jgi:DNA/RNA endonuclease G (NUC1)